jgi:hypothetical protein
MPRNSPRPAAAQNTQWEKPPAQVAAEEIVQMINELAPSDRDVIGMYLEWKGTALLFPGYLLMPMDLAEQFEAEFPRLYALLAKHRRPTNLERNKEIVRLHEEEGLSYGKIGRKLVMTADAVAHAYRRARAPGERSRKARRGH